MCKHDARRAGGNLVVHQQAELLVPAVEGTQSIGNADHSVALDGVAYGQDRDGPGASNAWGQIRFRARAGTDSNTFSMWFPLRERGRTSKQKWRCKRSFQK